MEIYNIVLSSLSIVFGIATQIQCAFLIREEGSANRFVGNVLESKTLPPKINKNNITGLKCSFLTGGNPLSNYFTIKENTGDIFVTKSLDRESICDQETYNCLVVLDVAISTDATAIDIFRVDIEIEDVNDNAPVFSETELYLILSEGADISAEFSIPTANDLDVGSNSAVTYYLDPVSDIFGIVSKVSLDGVSGAAIVLQKGLDRELTSFYKLRVLAKDGGNPQQTGTMFLTINVSDVNDNIPVMTQLTMNVILPENTPIGTLVFATTATDGDSGVNSKIRYRLHPRTTSFTAGLFDINSTSGDIHLISNLDFEERKSYKLIVEAFDGGVPSLSSQALVNVSVSDVNDNEPVVNVNYISGKTFAIVSEDAALNTFVAYISVTDADSGLNAVSDCHFEHEQFKIELLRENEYQVVTSSGLDRETDSEYYIELTCQDRGDPAIGGSGILHVKVTDQNDNAPYFAQSTFPLLLEESLQIGNTVLELSAVDIDDGTNAEISYAIVSSEPKSNLFHIDSKTGSISVARSLDRESLSSVLLVVTATDHGAVPRRNRASVNITILDVNDEFPVFSPKKYHFSVRENLQNVVMVGRVKASDADQGMNGQVRYTLLDNSVKSTLSINDKSGEIHTIHALDREFSPLIIFHVLATDMGEPALTSTTTVTIEVTDVNDNYPTFVFPRNNNNTCVFTLKVKSTSVTKILAEDPDSNSTLTYAMVGSTDLFSLNHSSGEIFLSRDLNIEHDSFEYTLNVSAIDSGVPALMSNSTLKLVFSISGESTGPEDFNIYIVVIVASLTIVFAAVIIGVIVVIRKHDANSKRGRENKGTYSNQQKRVSFIVRQDSQTFNDPWDEGEEKAVNLNNQRQRGRDSQKVHKKNLEDKVRHPNFSESSQQYRKPHQTWLTDFSSSEISEKLPDSMSELSERTFDSGKGGSDRGERFRGSNSLPQGAYTCDNYNREGASTGSHNTYHKTINPTRFSPAILSEDSQSGMHGHPVCCSTPECYTTEENGSRIREEIQSDISDRRRIGSEESYPGSPQYSDSQRAHSVFV